VSPILAKSNGESPIIDHSYDKLRQLPLDYVHHTASVTNSTLHVENAGYTSEGKIDPAELLPFMVK